MEVSPALLFFRGKIYVTFDLIKNFIFFMFSSKLDRSFALDYSNRLLLAQIELLNKNFTLHHIYCIISWGMVHKYLCFQFGY